MACFSMFCVKVVVLVVVAAAAAVDGMPNNKNFSTAGGVQNWKTGVNNVSDYWGFWHPNASGCGNSSKRIVVGGSENWRFGFNYSDWALNNAPFYLNDSLVFKYDPPNGTNHPHSVYMFQNYWSYKNCDLKRAKMIADPSKGAGQGFEFVLKKWQPHYFACGESNGIHCRLGLMKFAVMPFIHWRF